MAVMRKQIIFSAISILFIGAAVFFHLRSASDFSDSDLTGLTPEALSPAENVSENNATGTIVRENLPKENEAKTAGGNPALSAYQGEAIDVIGGDPAVKQTPAAYLEKYRQELSDWKIRLAKNPADLDGWLRVGVLKKFFNNYLGARDAWEYAKIVAPEGHIAYYNLGNLYGAYLNDFSRAEENYLEAVRLSRLPYLYLNLADFYRVFYKEKSGLAETVLLEGIKNNPDDSGLKLALANYYRDAGKTAEAIKYYEEVLKIEPANADVQKELEKIKR